MMPVLDARARDVIQPEVFRVVEPVTPDVLATIRRRAIFECCKWDPQVEDVCTIADVPVVLAPHAWTELRRHAEALAAEVAAAETELRGRPELHGDLGLPSGIVRALRHGAARPHQASVRFIRFDFHLTPNGWRISEANTDVPGGLNEASGLPMIVGPYFPGTQPAGDVAEAYADAVLAGLPHGARVALVHATAYTDDRQVMAYLARRLEALGARPSLVSPMHLQWRDGCAVMQRDAASDAVDAIVRFYPTEWMPDLPRACGWLSSLATTMTPVSNAPTAILTQSKRFPLTWDALRTPMPTWRALLPKTCDPRDVAWQGCDRWVAKPALGRVGEDILIAGVTPARDGDRIARAVRRRPSAWVVQERFDATPLRIGGAERYPSIGVYTVNERAVGAYGRIAERPLIDARARDAAVLVSEP